MLISAKKTAIDAYQWFHEVCTTALLNMPTGMGKIVEIDESLFRHKPKVCKIFSTITQSGSHHCHYSITVGAHLIIRFGYSEWWLHLKSLAWDTRRLYHLEMPTHLNQLSKGTRHQEPSFTQTSGELIILSVLSQQCHLMELWIIPFILWTQQVESIHRQ